MRAVFAGSTVAAVDDDAVVGLVASQAALGGDAGAGSDARRLGAAGHAVGEGRAFERGVDDHEVARTGPIQRLARAQRARRLQTGVDADVVLG